MRAQEFIVEDLRKWFKEKWVRFGPDGKIRGSCARGSEKEGKPKCLPQSKAHALGKKGRASAAARKRRQDPNPKRRGPAKNVATKRKNVSEGRVHFQYMTLAEIFKKVEGLKSLITTYDSPSAQHKIKDIISYAKYLKNKPEKIDLSPIKFVNDELYKGERRIKVLYLISEKLDPNNPFWKELEMPVEFETKDT